MLNEVQQLALAQNSHCLPIRNQLELEFENELRKHGDTNYFIIFGGGEIYLI